MDAGAWLRLAQLLIAAGGLIAVILTLQQKTNSDDRAEWWKRFTWAVENANNNDATAEVRKAARIELNELSQSYLAKQTETNLITSFYSTPEIETYSIEGKDGENNEHLD